MKNQLPMRFSFRLLTALCVLGWPLMAWAVAPATVTGLHATDGNGQVHVQWNASSESDIAYYRVYFSRKSILGNQGKYDDFIVTPGRTTDAVITDFPTNSPTLYVAVLAVNGQGEESPSFTEEASVSLTSDQTSSAATSSATSVAASSAASSLPTVIGQHLLSASPVSATGVLLTFALPVSLNQADAPNAFEVQDASGGMLQLRRLVITGDTVLIVTNPQVRTMLYTVHVSRVVLGKSGADMAVPLDVSGNMTTFVGSPDGIAPTPGTASSSQPIPPSPTSSSSTATVPQPIVIGDIRNLQLTAEPEPQGTYRVTATWEASNPPEELSAFSVRQTRDGGATFSDAQTVPSSIQTVRFSGVAPGNFGVGVQAVGTNGALSPDRINSSMHLASLEPQKTPLTQSGAGTLAAFLFAGAAMGWFQWKKIGTKLWA